MTIAILSPSRTSTSGRAPWFSITIRFWIKVESLKRPPTLFTIPSSFSSSSMAAPFKLPTDDRVELLDRRLEVVVEHDELVLPRAPQLLPGGGEPAEDRRLVVLAAQPQPPLVLLPAGGPQEDGHRVGALRPHLRRPLHVDDQDDADAP